MSESAAVVVDLSNYKETVGGRVSEGRHLVVVEDAENTTASKPNADTGEKSKGVILYLRVVAPGSEDDGTTLIDRLWLTPKSLFRIVAFMQSIGLPTPKKRLQIPLQQFIGKTLMVDVEDGQPYNGRVKSEVRGYAKAVAGSAPVEQAPADLDLPEDSSSDEVGEDEPIDLDSIESL